MLVKILLDNIRLSSPTGWYNEEEMAGNDLEIDLTITIKVKKEITTLSETLDYVSVYEVMRKQCSINHFLLEKLALAIMDDVAELDGRVKKINISIKKLNPPIPNFIGNVGILRSKKF